jgi:hypothetical protein
MPGLNKNFGCIFTIRGDLYQKKVDFFSSLA